MIARLEFELAYHDVTVQHMSHNTMKIPPPVCIFYILFVFIHNSLMDLILSSAKI